MRALTRTERCACNWRGTISPLTSRLRLSFSLNTDRDYSVGLHYILTSHLSVSTNYDKNLHWGVGLMLTY